MVLEKLILVYDIILIPGIYQNIPKYYIKRANFHEIIFGIFSLFKSQNLSCWNFNLLYLNYFVIISFGFGLSAHLKLTIENLGIRNC